MLKSILSFNISLFILIIQASAQTENFQQADTTDIKTRLIEQMRKFKKQNKVQIHKFQNSDSTIVFGSNKQRSFLTAVMILDKRHNKNQWFYFDSTGVFRVTIAEKRPTEIGNHRKKTTCSYYFDQGKIVYKIEDGNKYDPAILLIEATKYQQLAFPYLKIN